MVRIFNKLVRDKVVDYIDSKGENPKYHVADDNEYEKKILEKITEESMELASNSDISELADLLEVVDALIEFKGWTKRDIDAARAIKNEKKGRFTKRIVLESTD